jgi:hypothetical protein
MAARLDVDAVGDVLAGALVASRVVVGQRLRDGDRRVGDASTEPGGQVEHLARSPAPLGAVRVEPVDGLHDRGPRAEARQRRHQAGPDSVVVKDVVAAEQSVSRRHRRVAEGFQGTHRDGGHGDHPHAEVLGDGRGVAVAALRVDRHLVASLDEPGTDLLDVVLHAAEGGR